MSTANSPQPAPFARPRTSALAVASLVLSCISFFAWPLGFLPGIICGHLARREIRRNPGMEGDGMALAGLIIGYIFLAMFAFLVLFLIPAFFYLNIHARPNPPPPIHFHDLNSATSLLLAGWPR